jgi:ion channel-forming bestrophin family protein
MIEYDPHDWRSHLLDIRGSMVREILWRVLACVLWAAAVTIFYELAIAQADDPLRIWTMSIHTALGTALGLLLVVRTNSSYDRFWEGRRMWGNIINESRNLARFSHAMLAAPPQLRERTVQWLVAFVYSALHRLRGEKGLGPDAAQLPAEETRQVLSSDHVPLAAARQITSMLVEARDQGLLSDILLAEGDRNVQLLIDYVGSCERIHRTPLPFAYMVHLRRALLLYCYTLPLALVRDFDWWTIPCTLMVAYILFGIEEIGVEIEDPFGDDENDLPLEEFCATIKKNVEGLASAECGVRSAE